jgi:hypothetical protein
MNDDVIIQQRISGRSARTYRQARLLQGKWTVVRGDDHQLWHSNTAQPCCAMIQTKAAKDRAPTYPLDRGLG